MRTLAVIFFSICTALLPGLILAAEQDPALTVTSVPELRRLPREGPQKPVHVRITGVCFWRGTHNLTIFDGQEGAWVDVSKALKQGLLSPSNKQADDVVPGDELEIEGVVDFSEYAPNILPTSIRRIGKMQLPPAKRLPVALLLSGSADCQPVEVEGV